MENYCRLESCPIYAENIVTFKSGVDKVDTLFIMFNNTLQSSSEFVPIIYTSFIKRICKEIDVDYSSVGIAIQQPCFSRKLKAVDYNECAKSNLQIVIDNVKPDKIVCFGKNSLKYFTNKEKGSHNIGRVYFSSKCADIPIFTLFDPLEELDAYNKSFLPDYNDRKDAAIRSLRFFMKYGPQIKLKNFHIIKTPEHLQEIVDKIGSSLRVSFDFETTGVTHDDKPLGLGLHDVITNIAFYIPILITPFEYGKEEYTPYFSKEEWFKILKILWKFLQSSKQMVAHQHKFDADFFMQLTGGVLPDKPSHSDSQTARHLYNTKAVKHGLDDDLLYVPQMGGYDFKRKQEVKDDVSYTADTVTVETTGYYCDGDVQLTNILETFYVSKLGKQQQLLYREVMQRAVRCYAFAKNKGVKVDRDFAEDGIKRLKAEYEDKEKEFLSTYGFKPSQGKKLSKYLFEDLKLEPVKKTDSGANSADKDVLEALAEKYVDDKKVSDFLKQVEDIKFPTSVIRNSLQPYLNHVSRDGRIHADQNIAGTATLRRSCSKPNLQNMPKRDANKVWVRGILIPSNIDSSFIERDLSAVEMFVLGFMAGDKPLLDALEKNISPHAVSASSAFGIPIETFDKKKYKDQYAKGKELNFANVFGAGFETLYYRVNRFSDEKYRVTREELHTILDTWRKKHFAIVEYKQRELDKINRQGYVDTPFGHRRYVDAGKGNANTLFNTIMQSSSGLMILLSIVLAFEEIEKQNALDEFPFCFDIHDAEIFEFPREYQDQIERLTFQKTIEAANYMGMPTIGSEVDIYPERFGFK